MMNKTLEEREGTKGKLLDNNVYLLLKGLCYT